MGKKDPLEQISEMLHDEEFDDQRVATATKADIWARLINLVRDSDLDVEMFDRVATDQSPEAALKWAHRQLSEDG